MLALVTLGAYALAGLAVAGALARGEARGAGRLARAGLHAALWPLFLPVLLPSGTPEARDSDGARIDAAEATLAEALGRLGRELGDPLSLESARVRSLGMAMRAAARRLSELEALLASPGHDAQGLQRELDALGERPEARPVADILRERLAHLGRLEALRTGARADLERALARAGELATRLTLLRYTGTSAHAAGRARELTDTIDELCRTLDEARAA